MSGVKTASTVELAQQDKKLREQTALRLMESGVVIYRPDTTVIDGEVRVAPGAVIEPYVQLLGKTSIGAGCRIRSYSVIENCTLEENVVVRNHCVLEDATLRTGADVGPFARLRPGAEVCEEAHVGNFVEMKKARLGKGSKAGHLAYLGDAEIGEGANIGAGVITANYDGFRKSCTHIGNRVFVGSDSILVAPVSVGEGALIGAGSTITRDVPPDSLAVGRARQVTKEDWVASRRARRQREKEEEKSADKE